VSVLHYVKMQVSESALSSNYVKSGLHYEFVASTLLVKKKEQLTRYQILKDSGTATLKPRFTVNPESLFKAVNIFGTLRKVISGITFTTVKCVQKSRFIM
jgi:hypothetical protein